ncbi:MAG TPA: hypothetical protein VNK52_16595 [Hyphomicrobiaceae bacterium]|nr:hypothetical protein [Hyphomicrobiaceae bacterium]
MTRIALAVASLFAGLAAVGPAHAIDLSRLAGFDVEEAGISEFAPDIRSMARNPGRAARALRELSEELGEEEELAAIRRLVEEAIGEPKPKPKPMRTKSSEPRTMVASSKAVKNSVKEVKGGEPAAVTAGEPSGRSVICTRFVPSASTTIAADCE